MTDKKMYVDLNMNSNTITNVLDPTNAQDAATKTYVDTATAGARDAKESVRVATAASLPAYTRTTNVITATSNGALAAVDGVTLIANDRLLVKNGAAGADNGLYYVSQVGTGGTPYTLTRTTDADTSAEVTAGLYVWVEEGTANADTGWLLTTDNAITLNTTALTFTQVSGLGQVTAGSGLTKSANTLNIGANTGITVNADDIQTDHTVIPQLYSTTVGDGASTSITVTHNLGTRNVIVSVFRNSSPWDEIETYVDHASTTTCTVKFNSAPSSNQYTVVVHG